MVTNNNIGVNIQIKTFEKFKLNNYINFIEAMPDKKKCFWTGKKHFYLKKYNGSVNITE